MYTVRFNGVDYVCVTFSQAVAMARKTVEHGETATIFDDEGEQVASFQPREEQNEKNARIYRACQR